MHELLEVKAVQIQCAPAAAASVTEAAEVMGNAGSLTEEENDAAAKYVGARSDSKGNQGKAAVTHVAGFDRVREFCLHKVTTVFLPWIKL